MSHSSRKISFGIVNNLLTGSSLLRRRQIKNSRACATATAHLLRRVVQTYKTTDITSLINRVQEVGQRLTSAQPRELAVGNIVRRVIGVIRIEAEEDREAETSGQSEFSGDSATRSPAESRHALTRPDLTSSLSTLSPLNRGGLEPLELSTSIQAVSEDAAASSSHPQRPPMLTSHASYAASTGAPTTQSMFHLLSHPLSGVSSPTSTPGNQSPSVRANTTLQALSNSQVINDFRAEVVEAIDEIIEEISQADNQIAGYATEHIHSNETILTYTASVTVQKFLLKAAKHRKFTVIQVESYPNNSDSTHALVMGKLRDPSKKQQGQQAFHRTLTAAGVTVILVPDSAVFALMSRVNKVLLATHAVLANGGLVAACGAEIITKAAYMHKVPVMVLSAVYKLSPQYPFDLDSLIEYGKSDDLLQGDGVDLVDSIEVMNPLYDYVPPESVDLYITNL